MYGLNRLNSANHLITLFTATAASAATATYPRRLSRLIPPVRSISFTQSSRRRLMDPPSPAATAGIGDFVDVGEGGKIAGEDDEALPENESVTNDTHHTYERKVLPPELSRSTLTLTCESSAEGGVCDVYLVGTAHVSTVTCCYFDDFVFNCTILKQFHLSFQLVFPPLI